MAGEVRTTFETLPAEFLLDDLREFSFGTFFCTGTLKNEQNSMLNDFNENVCYVLKGMRNMRLLFSIV